MAISCEWYCQNIDAVCHCQSVWIGSPLLTPATIITYTTIITRTAAMLTNSERAWQESQPEWWCDSSSRMVQLRKANDSGYLCLIRTGTFSDSFSLLRQSYSPHSSPSHRNEAGHCIETSNDTAPENSQLPQRQVLTARPCQFRAAVRGEASRYWRHERCRCCASSAGYSAKAQSLWPRLLLSCALIIKVH